MPIVRITRRRFLGLAGGLLALYTIPGSARAYSVSVARHDIGLGATVLYVSDLHTHGGDRREHLDIIERLRPDILALGGDTWDLATPSISVVEDWISEASSIARFTVAVLGNHEYTAETRGRIRLAEGLRLLERYNIRILRDEVDQAMGLRIAGLDWRWDPVDYARAASRLDDIDRVDVIMAHSPDVMPHLGGFKGLVLAGHTHGGQVCLPGGRAIATNSVYGYASGVYREHGRVMIVSRGAGELVPPRLYCRRELVLVS